MSVVALPGQLFGRVTVVFGGNQLAATELRCLLQVADSQFGKRFAFIVAVVDVHRVLAPGKIRKIPVLPVWDGAVFLHAAVVGADAFFVVMLDPVLRAVGFLVGQRAQRHLDDERRRDFGEFEKPWQPVAQLTEIVVHGHVGAEVEVVLQHVGV